MEGSVGAPPQRVCPKCARVSWATGPQCPYCTASFRRSQGVAPWMLALTAAVVPLGVGLMFYITVQEVDERVGTVQGQIDRSIRTLQADVRRELDARIPPGAGLGNLPAAEPTIDPLPTETPTADPLEITPTPTATATATAEPTVEGDASPEASATATATVENQVDGP